MSDIKFKKELIHALENDNLIIFVGSGLSKGLGLPSWNEMVGVVLNELAHEDSKYNSLKNVLENKLFTEIEILDKILQMDPKNLGRVYDLLDNLFNIDFSSLDLNLQKKLGELSSSIITTNYDLALEAALPEFKTVIHDDEYRLGRLPGYKKYIFKIHGTIETPQSCILYKSDYERLYKKNSAAIERLKTLITDKTILFIGFSFNDQYVKDTFRYVHDVFKSFNSTHYIITTEEINYSDYGLLPIKIDSWGDLPYLIDKMLSHKDLLIEGPKKQIQMNLLDNPLSESRFKIALLYTNPIDTEAFYNIENICKYFVKFNLEIDCYHLTEENLNELENYNYLFIFTKQIQNKIIIEDEYFRKKLITIKQFEEEIALAKPEGIFLFFDKVSNLVDSEDLQFPMAAFRYEEKLNNFLFKLFKKAQLDKLDPVITFNPTSFLLSPVEKGNGTINKLHSHDLLSDKIERKNLINFVGRKIDITDIIRKTIDNPDKIITVKGSGGIGKTTIAKKIALEFSDRGLYKDGIDFIDCEFIKDYKTFERNIAKTFNLEESINFVEHIGNNNLKRDSLIILDNFEPLLYLDEIEEMKNLITFICDYKTILITSREWVGFEFEEKHELRGFTSEEAVNLFEKLYSSKIQIEEKRLLKEDILEKLLNNNPLAIKIVAQNIPKSISMKALKEELKDDFFRATNTEYVDIYDSEVDENIERSVSLYQSIYYSYKKLSTREQLVFEILSLFPNGLPMESFKNFFNTDEFRTDTYRITNKEIKSLENKSIIEINGGYISLQSIIGRFAEFHFNKRTAEEKYRYYKRAFAFNEYMLELLNGGLFSKLSIKSLQVFDKTEDNFLKSLEYIDEITFNDYLRPISYISNLVGYFHRIGQAKKFRRQLINCENIFSKVNNGLLLKSVMNTHLKYFEGDFDSALEYLLNKFPFERLENLEEETDSYIKKLIYDYVLNIYSHEGYEYNVLEFYIRKNYFDQVKDYSSELFKIGAYKLLEDQQVEQDFFSFELKFNQDKIDIDELDQYLEEGIYNKNYIEIMQTNYIKVKMGIYNKEQIEELVITNPYTMGIKDLMLAIIEEDIEKKGMLYELAIEKLAHIKYYYVEAIYYYCKFLKDENIDKYEYWYQFGKEQAENYKYYYHSYRFSSLNNDSEPTFYDEDTYLENFKKIIKDKQVYLAQVN